MQQKHVLNKYSHINQSDKSSSVPKISLKVKLVGSEEELKHGPGRNSESEAD